jgi:transcription elongation factor Elf1
MSAREGGRMKQVHRYKLDLSKIDGNGEFACPRCGNAISPDDDTEEAYSILGSKVNSRGLEELVIQCKKCGLHIHLTGFSLLQKLSEIDAAKQAGEKEKALWYISHV